jgi:hypothetical protein
MIPVSPSYILWDSYDIKCYQHGVRADPIEQWIPIVLSNSAMIPALIVCYRHKLQEGIAFFFVGLFSFLYHLCDAHFCVANPDVLWTLDYTFSYLAFTTTFVLVFHPLHGRHKGGHSSLLTIACFWCGVNQYPLQYLKIIQNWLTSYNLDYNRNWRVDNFQGYPVLPASLGLAILMFISLWFLNSYNYLSMKDAKLNPIDRSLAFLFTLTGLSCYLLDYLNASPFWKVHSLWHVSCHFFNAYLKVDYHYVGKLLLGACQNEYRSVLDTYSRSTYSVIIWVVSYSLCL